MFELFVEKKPAFRAKEEHLKNDLNHHLGTNVEDLRMIHLYYSESDFSKESIETIFSEPVLDEVSRELVIPEGYFALRTEFLPGQFDQRAYWANRSLEVLGETFEVRYSTIYLLKGLDKSLEKAASEFFINPVESRERALFDYKSDSKRTDRDVSFDSIEGFFERDNQEIVSSYDLAMNAEDVGEMKKYFKSEDRLPTWSELKVIDTYWSDHCRHTTFNTELTDVDFSQYNIPEAVLSYETYVKQKELFKKKPISLMDLALQSQRMFLKDGPRDIEVSEEINACSIERKVDGEDYLIMFKNETHNHPTEIEPFGGAATCLGGAIRDPLSGRSYVYQSMRITGARDPRILETLPSKLPQKTICKRAADGFSSYGNQIGLATGFVEEFYHPGFEAKRMEVGFVIAAAKKSHVKRSIPKPGELLLLVGGPTGRDGIGGASGSSKSHKEGVLEGSGSEVQKGNAVEERKLQRFFRREEIGPKIIRCNDFGAGGVSVAFGEIADGLEIELNKVPVKYEGIYPWELAISESQERMALVIDPSDLDTFMKIAKEENLNAVVVGEVNDTNRFRLKMDGKVFVDLSRDFLNSTGAKREAKAKPNPVDLKAYPYSEKDVARDELIKASRQALVEQFDSSIGSLNALAPFGGKTRKTPVKGMASYIPGSKTRDVMSVVGYGYDPYIATWSPYHGGEYAVVESMARVLALGGSIEGIRFTFQEYFEKLGEDPTRWAKPLLALLGASRVLNFFKLPAIGGKDSMSGSFITESMRLDVPPTLISFAVNTMESGELISPELKPTASKLSVFKTVLNENRSFDLEATKKSFEAFLEAKKKGLILSAAVVTSDIQNTLLEMSFGNEVGFKVNTEAVPYGTILAQVKEDVGEVIGEVTEDASFNGETIDLKDELQQREDILKDIYYLGEAPGKKYTPSSGKIEAGNDGKKEVKVLLPVFPGTNCEFDLERSFKAAGATVKRLIFRNLPGEILSSIDELYEAMLETDILAIPGGFSAADEPEGSAKFITSVFRNPKIKEAFSKLIERKGLVLGICNGFQALVKLGVFMDSKIMDPKEITMGLTYNEVGRHQAKVVYTKALSKKSPWLKYVDFEKEYPVPVSHGEGRFFADDKTLDHLYENGQIATTYIDNINGSFRDIEGIVSPDGLIFGKMAHNERAGVNQNIPCSNDMNLFQAAVDYFRKDK
ncbi:phosphoribosylformylglycinamidine synthase [Guggenheimella bovis]